MHVLAGLGVGDYDDVALARGDCRGGLEHGLDAEGVAGPARPSAEQMRRLPRVEVGDRRAEVQPVDVVQREPAGSGEGAPHRLEEQVHLPHVFEYRRLTRIEGADDRDVVERIAGHALRGRCYFRQCGG